MRQFKIFASFILMVLSFDLQAQDKDEQMAAQYFAENEFDKAADMYDKLLNRNPHSVYIYDNLLQSLFKLKRFDDAEKLVKKQIRKNENNPYYVVDLGYVYLQAAKPDKAKKQFDNIIEHLPASPDLTKETASAFKKRNEKQYAIHSYLKERKILDNPELFCVELGGLYAETGDKKEMIEEYLNSIIADPAMQEDVQGFLQNYMVSDPDFELLKSALLKRIKSFPKNDTYYEMLIWFYVQRKDFDNALVQTRALDKRYKEEGRRMIDLGYLALANEKYDAAVKIFNEIILFGKDKPYYIHCKQGILEAKNRKLLNSTFTEAELKLLEKEYQDFLYETGKNYYSAPSQRELAKLQAFYLNDYVAAISNFEELINMQGLDNKFRAQCKLDLGDIYVMKGEVWDAMLLYGQVDKEFLEEPIGQEAKLRNAQLSYYLGEFAWARAQLDVLKTATTQLIANNALELSLLIQDNTVDSIEDALKLFARADLDYSQNKLDEALGLLDSINLLFPKHALADDIVYKKAQIYFKRKNYNEAAVYFQRVVDEYGSDVLGDNALFALAELNEKQLGNKEKAQKLYEEFIDKYPGSFFITEVRKRYRILRGDLVDKG